MKLKREDEGISGGYRYTQKETKITLTALHLDELLAKVKSHRKANNLPIGLNFKEEVVEQICELVPSACYDEKASKGTLPKNKDRRTTLDIVQRGTRAILFWVKEGMKKVSQEEAQRRAEICAGCHFNQQITECTNCSLARIRSMVGTFVAASDKTTYDSSLHACAVCGCANRAAIWMELDLIHSNTPDDIDADLPSYCWKKKTQQQTE